MSDNRVGSKLPKWSTREDTPGVRVDSGPHIGIVKNNVDPARLGRLQIWIPDLGGDEIEPSGWYTVSYASPFLGATQGLPGSPDAGNFGTEQQTYGFWAMPPDLDNLVLVTFVMGDPNNGYYFACIPNTPVLHMLPGIARPIDQRYIVSDPGINGRVDTALSYLPVTELNTNIIERDNDPNFVTALKSVHIYQANIVIEQGLDTDPLRGTITSSAQRDTPSRVIGLSTPGRTTPDTTDFPDLDEQLKAGTLSIALLQSFSARKGGHTFVMDDGDIYGKSQLVRLRSAGGHTILMDDTEDIFYIINKKGTAWVELTTDGSINVYGKGSINLRAAKDLNLHADANINMHAGDTIRSYAGSSILSQTKIQLATADDLYNLNAGVIGVRSGGNMDLRAVKSSWETEGNIVIQSNANVSIKTTNLMNIKSGIFYANVANELVLNSATNAVTAVTSGWKTSGELWLKGSEIYLNTTAKVPIDPSGPVPPNPPAINPAFDLYKQPTAIFDNNVKRWFTTADQFESVAPFTPTHEPWPRQTGIKKFASGIVEDSIRQGKQS